MGWILLLVTFVGISREVWESHPALWACLVFWAFDAALLFAWWTQLDQRLSPVFWFQSAGQAMNAVVTIANNGTMPVPGPPLHGPGSIWVEMGDHHRLVWLADVLPGRLSLGDYFIAGGLGYLVALGIKWALSSFYRWCVITRSVTPAASEAP